MVIPDMHPDPTDFPTVIVVNENALACQADGWANWQILGSMRLKGGPDPMNGTMVVTERDATRPATVADFDAFRVSGPEHYGILA